MIKLELPEDEEKIQQINSCFEEYFKYLYKKMSKNLYMKEKLFEVCGNLLTFKKLIIGEWDEIMVSPSGTFINAYFLVGKFYSELLEIKESDGEDRRIAWVEKFQSEISRNESLRRFMSLGIFDQTSNFQNFERENKKVFVRFIELNKLIGKFLDYEAFRNRYRVKLWDLYKCEVCPYCNLIPISNHEDFSTADIEHFYCKSIFSLFSVSKFNLIPGCKDCNRQFKGTKYFHYNLRYTGLDDYFRFSYNNNSTIIDDYLSIEQSVNKNQITLRGKFIEEDSYAKKTISDLAIINRYNQISSSKGIICNFINETVRFRKSTEKFFSLYGDKETVFRQIFSLELSTFLSRRFMNEEKGKFKADIIDEFSEYIQELL